MAINGDSSWRWNFVNVGEGGTPAPYLKFWQNAIRWLIKDPDLKQVRVLMDKDNYHAGETVRGKVVAVGSGYAPLQNANVKVTVAVESASDDAEPPVVPPGVTGTQGEYRFELALPARGIYRVKAEVRQGGNGGNGRLVDKDETVFAFDTEDPELERAFVDPDFLARLANRGSGAVLPADPEAAAARIELPPSPPVRIVGERRMGLWDRPFVLLALLGLFSGEWILRRRWGLL